MGMNTYATHPWVAKNLNAASLDLDDMQVYVPEAGDNGKTIQISDPYVSDPNVNCEITDYDLDFSPPQTFILHTTITNCCEGTIVHKTETRTRGEAPLMSSSISTFEENANCSFANMNSP